MEQHPLNPSEETANKSSVWADYSDQDLAGMLESSEVSGEIKDEIAQFVAQRKQQETLPTDND